MATYNGADKRLAYLFQNGGGGGGSTVSITPTLQSGTKIADFSIDGSAGELFAPNGGGGSANIWTGTLAEYIAQAAQIEDGTQINITDDEIRSLVIPSYDIYSFQEREVGTWVDSKPLYQKTIRIGILTKDTNWHYISLDSSIETIVEVVGIFNLKVTSSGTSTFYPLPNYRPVNNVGISFGVQNNQLFYMNNWLDTAGNTGETYVTLKYTKTTDVAGSGMWTPQGTPAVHYSTDEQVIGTWIDGSTIYRKVFNLESQLEVSYNSWTTTNISISNVDKLMRCEGISNTKVFSSLIGYFDNNILKVQTPRNGNIQGVIYLILEYTKTT